MSDQSARLNRYRRVAQRQDLAIRKSRRRIGFEDGFMLVNVRGNYLVAGGHPFAYCLTLADVEDYLERAETSSARTS